MAPSVRVVIGEALGLKAGQNLEGQLVRALRNLGFAWVFDTMTGADLTIMEESQELITRCATAAWACALRVAPFCQRNAYHAPSHRIRDKLVHGDAALEPLPMFMSCCPGCATGAGCQRIHTRRRV